jgi:hypothetical protein
MVVSAFEHLLSRSGGTTCSSSRSINNSIMLGHRPPAGGVSDGQSTGGVSVLKHPLLHWQGLHSKANGELCFKKKEVFPQLLLAPDFYASVASVGNRLPDHYDTLALLSIVPPEPENSSSKAETPINSVYSLRVMHILDLMCCPPTWYNNQPVILKRGSGTFCVSSLKQGSRTFCVSSIR